VLLQTLLINIAFFDGHDMFPLGFVDIFFMIWFDWLYWFNPLVFLLTSESSYTV